MKYLFSVFFSVILSTSSYAATVSPFESMEYIRFPFLTAKVMIEGSEFYLLGIDGVDAKEILAKCEAQFSKVDCEGSFVTDYKTTMESLGYTVGDEATLRLYVFQGHQVTEKTVSLIAE